MAQLRTRIAERVAQVPAAQVAVSYRDLGRPDSLDMDATVDFHAASTMKIPVMIEVLRAVDAGRLSLDQRVLLVNRFHSIVDGSPYRLDSGSDSDSSVYTHVGERVAVRDLLALEPGAVVELDRSAGTPADILLNGRLIAHGDIVVIDQDYAVRITKILDSPEAAL